MPKNVVTKTLAFLAALWSVSLFAQDATLLAPGDALSSDEQQQTFHLLPGFEIQLVASEPEIGQPMNLQFDAAGRLWVTSSVEYPYPAEGPGVEARDENFAGSDEPHPPRDWVAVISGIGSDGKPQKITRFTEGLNIPIGHLPLEKGALVYSIPSLDRYVDADGDGVADERKPLITGFGNVDTHGMCNGLRRWIDGWIYASHGFRNTSHLKGPDGRELTMNSGNTFRFRPDGTGLEQYTWGEVNPFGLAFDPLGNLYSADCHSMPLTCLLRGAYYPSFGKPHDGLGFGPKMIDHSHGSTGICGPAFYAATQFPQDYRDNLFLCNPVTGRVHRDKLVWRGSSPSVDTQPDFITCDDGWFRPVDLTVGPDGALYLADFYNAIIGHYEMPLGHPKRDRSKGRVWRIVYVGGESGAGATVPGPQDLSGDSAEELVELLGDENLQVRVTASHELVDQHGKNAIPLLVDVLRSAEANSGAIADAQRAHAMWVLERLSALEPALLTSLSEDESGLVRTHVAKLIAERSEWTNFEREIGSRLLSDVDPFVRRAAVDALGRHGGLGDISHLLAMLATTSADDTHLVHTIRIAIRNLMANAERLAELPLESFSSVDLKTIAGIAPAVKTKAAARLLASILILDSSENNDAVAEAEWPEAFGHVFRYGEPNELAELIGVVQSTFDADLERQFNLLDAARTALQARGADPRSLLAEWGTDLASRTLETSSRELGWVESYSANDSATWTQQQRKSADGVEALFWSSLPSGEQRTGVLRSQAFVAPSELSFYLAGHAGFPGKDAHGLNAVRLYDASSGQVLREAFPPRNDTAQRVEWDLQDREGDQVFLELQDGDTGKSYAWLAVGRFSVDGLNAGGSATSPQRAAELIVDLQLTSLMPRLRDMLADPESTDSVRAAAATAIVGLKKDAVLTALVPLMGDPATPQPLKEEVAAASLSDAQEQIRNAVASAVKTLPSVAQQPLAERLSGTPAGANALLALIEQGHASARLLTRPAIRERFAAHAGRDFASRIEAVTADLPAEDEALRKVIDERTRAFDPNAADAQRGVAVFTKNCANCHRIGAEGSLVGPQLDGIGVRGLTRIAEDVLDPNRNVDGAFRSSTLVLADGRVVTGLVRREEGESLVLADNAGKEFSVLKEEIEERATSPLSLMPANFGEAIPPEQFADLMAYLLSQRQAK